MLDECHGTEFDPIRARRRILSILLLKYPGNSYCTHYAISPQWCRFEILENDLPLWTTYFANNREHNQMCAI